MSMYSIGQGLKSATTLSKITIYEALLIAGHKQGLRETVSTPSGQYPWFSRSLQGRGTKRLVKWDRGESSVLVDLQGRAGTFKGMLVADLDWLPGEASWRRI